MACKAGRAKYEHISTAVVQTQAWTMENDMLTPTLKVRRGKIDEVFQEKYLQWHQAPEKVIWE